MKLTLHSTTTTSRRLSWLHHLCSFLQSMIHRAEMGEWRYGPPRADRDYMGRLKREVRAYESTGNVEYLYNIAVYAALERYWPLRE